MVSRCKLLLTWGLILVIIGCSQDPAIITLDLEGTKVERGARIIALIDGHQASEGQVFLAGKQVPSQILSENALSFIIPEDSPTGDQELHIRAGPASAKFTLTILDTGSSEGKMLIIVKPDVTQEALASELTKLGFSLDGDLTSLGANEGPCSGMLATVAIGEQDPGKAEVTLKALEDAFLLEPWGKAGDASPLIDPVSDYDVDFADYSDAIGVNVAHNRGYGGQGVTIAVLDTGVTEHEDLFGRLLEGRSFVGEADKGKLDVLADGHGTPIALLAAGSKQGVAPQANILPVRVCDSEGNCPAPAVIQGLCFALNHATETGRLNRMVLNLSWGSSEPSDIVKNILGYVGSRGVLSAAAVGNDYEDDKNVINYPAHYPVNGLHAVAALKQVENEWWPTDYSNRGPHVDISAPGDSLSLSVGTYSGTSFATALVAGSLALYRESFEYKQAAAHEVESAVKTDATKLPGAPREEAVGLGMISVRNLLTSEYVLRPDADRDNIHYYIFLDETEWPWFQLMEGNHNSFNVSMGSQGFLKFDLSAFDKPVETAKLQIYRYRNDSQDNCTVKFYEVLEDNWLEGELNSLPSVDKRKELGLVEVSSDAYAKIDISSYARSQQEDGVMSIAFDCDLNEWVSFGAREGGFDQAPKLILGFEE